MNRKKTESSSLQKTVLIQVTYRGCSRMVAVTNKYISHLPKQKCWTSRKVFLLHT